MNKIKGSVFKRQAVEDVAQTKVGIGRLDGVGKDGADIHAVAFGVRIICRHLENPGAGATTHVQNARATRGISRWIQERANWGNEIARESTFKKKVLGMGEYNEERGDIRIMQLIWNIAF